MATRTDALIDAADRAREDPSAASAYDLWGIAREQAPAHDDRVRRLRHAMIHSGHLTDARGLVYLTCPVCDATLPAVGSRAA